jgi:hypothetical protein
MGRKFQLHDGHSGSALALRITPRARKNAIVGVQSDGTIKIHITAPPVDDKANQALISFLAEVLGIAKSRIEIVAGDSGRDKLVSILDMSASTAHKKILAQLD